MALIYKVSGVAIPDIEALGKETNGNAAVNFANQLMADAKLVGMKEGKRQFESKGGKYLLTVHASEKIVERIVLRNAATVETLPEFHGQYRLSNHAYQRYCERFPEMAGNHPIQSAQKYLNGLLMTSTLHSKTPGKKNECHLYDSFKHNIRFVIDKADQTIVTVHMIKSEPTPIIEKDSPLFGAIIAATKRELGKARRAFRKTNRELTEQLASIQIEMAHAMVNKTRAKGDHIVSAVERKMNELAEQERKVVAMLDAERAKFERVEADAGAVIGGGR